MVFSSYQHQQMFPILETQFHFAYVLGNVYPFKTSRLSKLSKINALELVTCRIFHTVNFITLCTELFLLTCICTYTR